METTPQSSSSPLAPARHFDALVKSFFIGPTQEVDEPEVETDREVMTRSPSRMGFLDDSDEDDDQVPASPSWAKGKASGEGPGGQVKAGGPRDGRRVGSESDSSDEWSDDDSYSADLVFCAAAPPPLLRHITQHPPALPQTAPPAHPPAAALHPYFLVPEVDAPLLPPPPRPVAHHGLSRSALQHHKYLWSTRYEEWMQWHLDVERIAAEASAYGGIVDTAAIAPPPSIRTRVQSPYTGTQAGGEEEVNPAIFPRAGDLSALRDPQVAQIDQCFQRLSLWTIKKVLFVFNMERKLSREEEQCGQGDAASAGLNGEHSSSGSEGDLTLVEEPGSIPPAKEDVDADGATCEKQRDNRARVPATSPAAWENSWQARWEVLTELVRRNQESLRTGAEDIAASLGLPRNSGSLESPQADGALATSPTKFFFAEDGPGEGGLDREAGDESEDDYGEVLMNPQFTRPFESGIELAREFLENEGMKIDVRSGAKMLCI